MSAAPTMTIHFKILSGDTFPLTVHAGITAFQVYSRLFHDVLPEELRPHAMYMLSIFSCREEEEDSMPIPRNDEVFLADDGKYFCLAFRSRFLRLNQYEAWVVYVGQETHEDGSVYELYRFGIDPPMGGSYLPTVPMLKQTFCINEHNQSLYSYDIIHTNNGIRFVNYARMYHPLELFQEYIQERSSSFSNEKINEFCQKLLQELEQIRQSWTFFIENFSLPYKAAKTDSGSVA